MGVHRIRFTWGLAIASVVALMSLTTSCTTSSRPPPYVYMPPTIQVEEPGQEVSRPTDRRSRPEPRRSPRATPSPAPAVVEVEVADAEEAEAPRRGLFGRRTSSAENDTDEPRLSRRERRAAAEQAEQDAMLEADTDESGMDLAMHVVSGYRLQAGDPVYVYLRGIPEASDYEFVLPHDGYINLPYISPVQAIGLTTSELQRRIHDTYIGEQIYRQITVNVILPNQSYFVRGEVRQPGRFPLTSGMTLLRAIAAAGGYTEYARPSRVQIMRADDGSTEVHNARRLEQNPEQDVEIRARDVITVRRSIF